MSFWCLQFSQKMNENNSTWGTLVVKSNFFVRFFGELKVPKGHFEINWPLVFSFSKMSDKLSTCGNPINKFKNKIYIIINKKTQSFLILLN